MLEKEGKVVASGIKKSSTKLSKLVDEVTQKVGKASVDAPGEP